MRQSPEGRRESSAERAGGTSRDGQHRRADREPPHRWPYAVLAYVFVALALVGVVVPGLPTTPFVLLAAWCASRGSRRLHDWLVQHPRLGPPLLDWREQGAVSRRAKVLATSFLAASWTIMHWRDTPSWMLALLAVLFIAVASFVITRPVPRTR